MAQIDVRQLVKEFTYIKPRTGLSGMISNLVRPAREHVRAVDSISFAIEAGEMVGFIGPNGAGKSTTVKMLSGILHPTDGTIRINGLSPYHDRARVCRHLGVVFGQRTQLLWDLRLGESYELLRRIYEVKSVDFQVIMKRLDQVLAIGELLSIPVRQLSLGQRMRGDLAAAMLHSPPILFLDEPTIGLDIIAKQQVRQFVHDVNQMSGTTVILTTHDLDDVEKLCDRLIVINRGQIIADDDLGRLITQYHLEKTEIEELVLKLYQQ